MVLLLVIRHHGNMIIINDGINCYIAVTTSTNSSYITSNNNADDTIN